mmetsp:Transcript_49376/g.124346  ORF Transcript_49376/g.124346 Transcript_49376/m.124346 type:complete len:82 (-) Transcript_49376:34-279(-)
MLLTAMLVIAAVGDIPSIRWVMICGWMMLLLRVWPELPRDEVRLLALLTEDGLLVLMRDATVEQVLELAAGDVTSLLLRSS